MKVFRIIHRSFRDAFKSISRNFSLSFASIMCTTITLILVAVAIVCAANIDNITKKAEDGLEIVVYLKKDATEEQISNIKSELNAEDTIEKFTFKSKDEWKLEIQAREDGFSNMLDYLDENPLFDSFIVKVHDVKDLVATAEVIKDIEGVNTVTYGDKMVEKVIKAFDIVEKAVLVVVVALVVVTAVLISNTIKLTIFSRKTEIEIMRLVGASNTFINLPFVIEGFVIGIIGSIIPICITIYGYVILYTQVNGLLPNMAMLIKPYNFVFWVALILVLIGVIVGMLGSFKAVRKYLKI